MEMPTVTEAACIRCRTEIPLKGYICEWCTAEEYQRIRRLPVEQWNEAKDDFDRAKFGFVPPYKSPEEQFEAATEAMKRLGETFRALGVDVELPGE